MIRSLPKNDEDRKKYLGFKKDIGRTALGIEVGCSVKNQ
jgi:hypothetical protein